MAKSPFKKSMKNTYQNFIIYSFVSAALTFILGLIIVLLPNLSVEVAGIIAGVSCIASGISSLYNYLKRDGAKLFGLSLVFAVIYFALALILIVYPYEVKNFLTICLGLYLLIKGALKIDYAFWFKKGEDASWTVTLGSGIVLIIIGILLMINPFGDGLALNYLVGAYLILLAIVDFTNAFMFKKRTKEIMDIFW